MENLVWKTIREGKKNGKKGEKMKEVIHIEFNTDDDVEMEPKNANDGKQKGKFK